jgi:hypothetical protein
MDTSVIDELTANVTMLKGLLSACQDETRKRSTITHLKELFTSYKIANLNRQLDQISDELYHEIIGTQPVQERPCEI